MFRYWFDWNLIWQFWVHTKRIDRFPLWFEWLFVTLAASQATNVLRNFGPKRDFRHALIDCQPQLRAKLFFDDTKDF